MEEWCSSDDDDNASSKKSCLKRSASTQGLQATSSGMFGVKGTKSCSGPFDNSPDTEISQYQHHVESYIEGLFREKQQSDVGSVRTATSVATTDGAVATSEEMSIGGVDVDSKHSSSQESQGGLLTKDLAANRIVIVRSDMLLYRGRQYSITDIATSWKKDYRMWLWKGEKKRNQSLNDMKITRSHLYPETKKYE